MKETRVALTLSVNLFFKGKVKVSKTRVFETLTLPLKNKFTESVRATLVSFIALEGLFAAWWFYYVFSTTIMAHAQMWVSWEIKPCLDAIFGCADRAFAGQKRFEFSRTRAFKLEFFENSNFSKTRVFENPSFRKIRVFKKLELESPRSWKLEPFLPRKGSVSTSEDCI